MKVVVYDDDGKACYAYDTGKDIDPGLDERRRIADALLYAYNQVIMRIPAFKVIGE